MRTTVLTLAILAAVASASAGERPIRIQGSALAMERLGELRPMLARALPDLEIDWIPAGAGSAFVGLFEGSADLVVSSREMEERERTLASRLSLEIREQVLAQDALAVVVHPDNAVASLSLDQLRTILEGRIVAWHGVGGPDVPLRLLTPPRSSGNVQWLERTVLHPEGELTSQAVALESESAVLEAVSFDRHAVGLVSASLDRSRVKTVPVEAANSDAAIEPREPSIEDGSYPLSRLIWIYLRGTPDESLRRVLSFLLLRDGQEEIRKAGFVPVLAERPVQRAVAARSRAASATVTRVSFGFGRSYLDFASRQALEELAGSMPRDGGQVWITGHSEPNEPGEGTLSRERALAVDAFLRERGVEVFRIEGRGAREPIPAPTGPSGRRAELWRLPPP